MCRQFNRMGPNANIQTYRHRYKHDEIWSIEWATSHGSIWRRRRRRRRRERWWYGRANGQMKERCNVQSRQISSNSGRLRSTFHPSVACNHILTSLTHTHTKKTYKRRLGTHAIQHELKWRFGESWRMGASRSNGSYQKGLPTNKVSSIAWVKRFCFSSHWSCRTRHCQSVGWLIEINCCGQVIANCGSLYGMVYIADKGSFFWWWCWWWWWWFVCRRHKDHYIAISKASPSLPFVLLEDTTTTTTTHMCCVEFTLLIDHSHSFMY